jgi:hypothetical protein
MAIEFPSNPTVNQIFTAGGKTWIWIGSRWRQLVTGTSVSATVPDYPTEGKLWLNSESGDLYVYAAGGWILSGGGGGGSGQDGATGATGPAGSNGAPGQSVTNAYVWFTG